jgi:hypothetical protein
MAYNVWNVTAEHWTSKDDFKTRKEAKEYLEKNCRYEWLTDEYKVMKTTNESK